MYNKINKNFMTAPSMAAFENLEVRAIIYFENEFREVAEEDANNVVRKCDFDSIFDEAEPYIQEFVEDQYDDFESFVDEHAAIFPESSSGLSVRVASHEEVLRYVNASAVNDAVSYFVHKIKNYAALNEFYFVKKEAVHNFYHQNCPDYYKNIVDANYETFDDFLDAHSTSFPRIVKNFATSPPTAAFENLEVHAILYFENEFREVAEDEANNVVPKCDFDSIFYEAEPYIKEFVEDQYDDFESFVYEHAAIFPESKSGLSVRVASHEEVLRYVNASAVNDAVSYFVWKIKEYAEQNEFYFVKRETVHNFYHHNCPEYYENIVDANYETFDDFLNAHPSSFPRTKGNNFAASWPRAAFENLEIDAIIYFENEFREVAEDEANNVVPKCDFSSIFDEAEPYIKEFVEDQYDDFESFVDEHAAIFPESNSGLSVRVASHEEVLRYVNASAMNDAVSYFVQKIKDYAEQNQFYIVQKETVHNFYYQNCPDYYKNIVDANYETFDDFLDAHSTSFPRNENENQFRV